MLFEPYCKPNRRFTPEEEETEIQLCKWMKRPKRHFFYDTPFYPWVVPEPLVNQYVNFDLVKGFNKGQH